ncbi:hypothetical protein GCM10011400_70590 [Paraburkholderia caffeinilytica]|uniref:Uncharacterized protein n=1 Tax=Paraburkholderia caffeinilytica TaxID=1761016 RepID=A0ABQ1NDE2_9BURK|nr:hypothetical protein GCM10011400_70590 [Paraburkholderia caffeinilytica]
MQKRRARCEVLARMAAGEDQPVDQGGVPKVRLDKGDSHGARSAWQLPGARFLRKAYSLPNITPTPKLIRYAESAVPNLYS